MRSFKGDIRSLTPGAYVPFNALPFDIYTGVYTDDTLNGGASGTAVVPSVAVGGKYLLVCDHRPQRSTLSVTLDGIAASLIEFPGVPGSAGSVGINYLSGTLQFHSSDVGKDVVASYKHLGTVQDAGSFNQLQVDLANVVAGGVSSVNSQTGAVSLSFLNLTDVPDSYGTAGQALVVNGAGTALVFDDVAGGSVPVIAKGDLFTFGEAPDRLAVNDDGFILVADSTEPTGLKWVENDAANLTGTLDAARLPTGIDAAKIAGGNVSSTEFDYLNGVTSGIQGQINALGGGGGGTTSVEALSKRWLKLQSQVDAAAMTPINCTVSVFPTGANTSANDSVSPLITVLGTNGQEASNYLPLIYRMSWKPDTSFYVKTDSNITSQHIFVGLCNAGGGASATAFPASTDWVGFRFNPEVNGNWRAGTCNSGGGSNYTNIDTGVTVAASTRYTLRLSYDGTTVTFYINGSQVGTSTTFIPTSTSMTIVASIYGNGADRSIGYDKMYTEFNY